MVLESAVEAYVVSQTSQRGGKAIKLTNYRGIPDRLILLPGCIVAFAECKRPKGGRLSPAQKMWGRLAKHLDVPYYTPCTREEVNAMLEELTDDQS